MDETKHVGESSVFSFDIEEAELAVSPEFPSVSFKELEVKQNNHPDIPSSMTPKVNFAQRPLVHSSKFKPKSLLGQFSPVHHGNLGKSTSVEFNFSSKYAVLKSCSQNADYSYS